MSNILDMRNLRVQAPTGQVLVDGVSLTLAVGEVLGLIGESGAGKSTIGLAALGYARGQCRIVDGEVWLAGENIMAASSAQRRALRGSRIAYVAQSAAAAFNPALTIGAQVVEGPLRHGSMTRAAALAWARELYLALDLPDPDHFGQRYAHQVSGGQLQRAMVAMAMSCKPDVLVLDEPTSALDVTTQIEVLVILRKVVREFGTAALYISHDLALVAQIADRVLVLRHGKQVEEGRTEAVLHAPREAYTQQLVAERAATTAPQAQAGTAPLLTVENLTAGYHGNTILREINFTLGRGETLALVGESGSGKSTVARAIVGLIAQQSGRLRFDAEPLPAQLGARTREHKRRIQLVYQLPDVALNPQQSIHEIIGRPASFYFGLDAKAARSRVRELLQLVALPESCIDRRPGQLSGGQKQRVCIARALAAKPDLIICDEVTSALDPLVAEGILQLLESLQERIGLSYLFITHDLGTVRRIAQRVAVMLSGEIIACGQTDTIFSAPMHPYTERLLSSVPEMRMGWLDHALARQRP
ncbi:ABC transporter ATP-binding protein [Verminephrobacter eiseniae]|uniref:ABC transporter related n=1 Tax=Verminephrobacter eiseniae (strain EF01-2) TaxID=391735 RepID=A1WEZ3_VEREI|nr:ABC transporter ATP-binding protein [Verminephrobacter eiseniae]ABM56200.1 ABC transporter related [Verminephrobacter eiseniae EF01-2]MCW5286570.1 ABC transporter ATP-binding protein [Verminephrobacter eiseniae]MCW5304869.1 ABC transporter ATP-binding protein [Verminephrobacter eiseniae]MCW8178299.1 ABC transporter ATP-binding protein [Verminephrobacter eiseniae]MCW8190039.1 ABC transporter ATP-binding protein [Verminephrobacter eiseniae]